MHAETSIFDWPGIGGREERATGQARSEAHELARALAAHSIAVERDAVIEEFDERVRTIEATVWPDDPLKGYGLHSSLGAFFLAKVAVGMVPSGNQALRHEPLRREGLFAGLTEHGVAEAIALSVIGDWQGVPEGFTGDRAGLDPSIIAGLAERTLTRTERDRALSQVAVSARCLDRLAATCNLLEAARAVMPVLPPESLGPKFASAVAALALGRPDRVVELFGERAESLGLETMTELAAAQWALGRVEPVALDDEGLILTPPLEEVDADEDSVDVWDKDATDGGTGQGEEEDDVLEIVEERVDPSFLPKTAPVQALVPRPPRWSDDSTAVELSEEILKEWNQARRAAQARPGRSGRILGLDVAGSSSVVPPIPVPPDERLIADLMHREDDSGELTQRIPIAELLAGDGPKADGSVFDPLLPPIRGVIRAVGAAAEGRGPSEAAVEAAGDLTWAIRRARTLALIVRGELEAAADVVASMPPENAPEGRWAKDLLLRYEGREQVPVTPAEARPAAAALIADLAAQLSRTIAGTLESDLEGAQSNGES